MGTCFINASSETSSSVSHSSKRASVASMAAAQQTAQEPKRFVPSAALSANAPHFWNQKYMIQEALEGLDFIELSRISSISKWFHHYAQQAKMPTGQSWVSNVRNLFGNKNRETISSIINKVTTMCCRSENPAAALEVIALNYFNAVPMEKRFWDWEPKTNKLTMLKRQEIEALAKLRAKKTELEQKIKKQQAPGISADTLALATINIQYADALKPLVECMRELQPYALAAKMHLGICGNMLGMINLGAAGIDQRTARHWLLTDSLPDELFILNKAFNLPILDPQDFENGTANWLLGLHRSNNNNAELDNAIISRMPTIHCCLSRQLSQSSTGKDAILAQALKKAAKKRIETLFPTKLAQALYPVDPEVDTAAFKLRILTYELTKTSSPQLKDLILSCGVKLIKQIIDAEDEDKDMLTAYRDVAHSAREWHCYIPHEQSAQKNILKHMETAIGFAETSVTLAEAGDELDPEDLISAAVINYYSYAYTRHIEKIKKAGFYFQRLMNEFGHYVTIYHANIAADAFKDMTWEYFLAGNRHEADQTLQCGCKALDIAIELIATTPMEDLENIASRIQAMIIDIAELTDEVPASHTVMAGFVQKLNEYLVAIEREIDEPSLRLVPNSLKIGNEMEEKKNGLSN